MSTASRNFLSSLHTGSVMTQTFGTDSTLERVHRLVSSAYAHNVLYETFLSCSTIRTYQVPGAHHGLVIFFAYQELNVHPTDKLWINTAHLGLPAPYCIVDIIVENPTRVVPSRLFIPYEGTHRSEVALQQTDMLPLFFVRSDGGVGIRVDDASMRLDVLPDGPTRIHAHSLKVVLHLVNYELDERQIQLRTSPLAPNISIRRLARLIASKVRCFLKKAERDNATLARWEDPRWKIGSGVGCIGAEDVMLLGIVFVSPGKVTPLLRVRDDYVFTI
ncbi:unnamed protein product [Peniophora sp. CBMAI 1063]|nr:unnamed protein product [Peniophora sp. CBMAI 1063]